MSCGDIVGDNAPDVLLQRNTQGGGPGLGAPLGLLVQADPHFHVDRHTEFASVALL